MFRFFKKKSEPKREMAAVADGQVVPMNEATDPVFSSCALGGGVVILPEGEIIVAPDDGTITATMDGKGILHGNHADCHGRRADGRNTVPDRNFCKSR